MPELPEVETLARELRTRLVDRRIREIQIIQKSRVFQAPEDLLKRSLPGARIKKIVRRGKFLLFELSRANLLSFHLGMTGQLILKPDEFQEKDPHLHLVIKFEGSGERLEFRDIRRFGKVFFSKGHSGADCPAHKLGPEPFEITAGEFSGIFKFCKGRIKSVLLDQKKIAGLGNIYADEALFGAGIDPRRRPCKLSGPALEKLHSIICAVLTEAIQHGGSSIDDYVRSDGSRGGFQERHRVYGRGKKPCRICGTIIRRIVLGGRSSFFCPKCQK